MDLDQALAHVVAGELAKWSEEDRQVALDAIHAGRVYVRAEGDRGLVVFDDELPDGPDLPAVEVDLAELRAMVGSIPGVDDDA